MPLSGLDSEPDDAYVNLADFGLIPDPTLVGDTTLWSLDTGDYNFYGTVYDLLEFGDDGFAIFDGATNYAGQPWVPQTIPDGAAPNNVAAMFWQDFEIFSTGADGITLADLTADGTPVANVIEYDAVQPFGGGPALMDFQMFIPFEIGEGPELVYAYDNIAADIPGTIGVENSTGTRAEAYLNNDALSTVGLADGDAVCFDLTANVQDPVVLT